MKLYFKQRFFSWFDSYDIYGEDGSVLFPVEGQLSWGHTLHILNARGDHIATVKQVVLTWLPKFEFYIGEQYVGMLQKEFSFLQPRYNIDFNGWHIEGNWLEWDYQIQRDDGSPAAVISKELLHWTDTYTIETEYDRMVVLAIDAEKCSRS